MTARSNTGGFAYVEVLVAAAVLVIALVPAGDGIRAAARQAEYARLLIPQHYRALQALETSREQRFADLLAEASATSGSTPSKWSDAAGSSYRRLVYVSRIDFDNADRDNNLNTGIDLDVVRINVQVQGTPISIFALASNRS